MFLSDGKCLKECSVGFYSDLEKNCLKCDSKCAECITEKQCTRCVNENDSLFNYECKDKCPEGSVSIYITEENPNDKATKRVKRCKNCIDEKCGKCDANNLNNCLQCKGNNLLLDTENGVSTCIDKCPVKYFEVKTTKRCQSCSENCNQCEDEKTCKKCERGLIENGICVKSCSKGYFQKGEECLKCEAENCSICSTKEPTKCIVCNEKFLLKNGECVNICGDNYYQVNIEDLGSLCKPCIFNCKTCGNDIECKECFLPKYVSGHHGVCVDCKENSGSVIIGKECYACKINNCAKCPADISRLGECEKCLPDFYMTPSGKCEADCPIGFYKNKENGRCVKCLEEKCSKCNPENNCESCQDNLLLQNQKCQKECNVGFYEDEYKVCKPCGDQNCAVCDKKHNDKCISCKDPFALKFEFVIFFFTSFYQFLKEFLNIS
jgi:proprotein convertase subtilisin/kexin type 5